MNERHFGMHAAEVECLHLRLVKLEGLVALQARAVHAGEGRLFDDHLLERGELFRREIALRRRRHFAWAEVLSRCLEFFEIDRRDTAFFQVGNGLVDLQRAAEIGLGPIVAFVAGKTRMILRNRSGVEVILGSPVPKSKHCPEAAQDRDEETDEL